MIRSSFRRSQIEREPVLLTPIPPDMRRGVMARVDGQARPVSKPVTFRSEKHLARVRKLPCVDCGKWGETQAAHMNLGKGQGIKASDAATASLCVDCHRRLDQGGTMTRAERRAYEWEMVARTYIALMEEGGVG